MAIIVCLIGLFYFVTSFIAARAFFMAVVIESAIRSIELKPAKPQWSPIWWIASTLIICLGGVTAVFQLNLAKWFFTLGAISQALFLYWLGPKFWDDTEDFDAAGRQKSKQAFYLYCGATAAVWFAAQSNSLAAVTELSSAALACATITALGSALWFIKNVWTHREQLSGAGLLTASDGEYNVSADDSDQSAPLPEKIIIRLSQNDEFFFDAATGDAIYDPFTFFNLPFTVENAFTDWMSHWVNAHDASDPYRVRLLNKDDQIGLDRAANHAFLELQKYLQTRPLAIDKKTVLLPEQFTLAPLNEPQPPKLKTGAIKLMLEFQCRPLWFDIEAPESDRQQVGDFSGDDVGLSWKLSRDLDQWALEFDETWDLDNPSAGPQMSAKQIAQANEMGLRLLARIRDELEQTNRSYVALRYTKLHPNNPPETH